VVQVACHPERALCEVKDLGGLRDASRSLRRNKRAFSPLPYQTSPLPKLN
jgi:hypothetical protein